MYVYLLALLLVFAAFIFSLFGPTIRHASKIRAAKKVLKRLQEINNPGQKISYLRKIDPFVFEELVLLAYKNQGHKIKRNKKYTGDGGIDGQVWISGQHYFIQAKRYSSAINPAHVTDFSKLVASNEGSMGLFVHTGRTGEKSKSNAINSIGFVSGNKLLSLLC